MFFELFGDILWSSTVLNSTQYTMGTLNKQPTQSVLKIQICLMVSKIYSI